MIYAGIAPGAFTNYIMQKLMNINIFSKIIEHPLETKEFDWVVFSGGGDINPSIYNEENISSSYNMNRDAFEILVWNSINFNKQKVLGICRGHQLINALLGGKLVQDIYNPHPSLHTINVLKRHPILSGINEVSSLHHQGVIKLGNGMNPIAEFEDVNELAISNDERVITTQFHPEIMDMKFWYNLADFWS